MREENILQNVQARCVMFASFISVWLVYLTIQTLFSSTELFSALNALKYDPNLRPHILDVRGRGLMVGVEFASPFSPGSEYDLAAPLQTSSSSSTNEVSVSHPANMASRVAKKCIEKGMLLLTTSVYEVVRFIPPLNVSKQDLAKGCAIFGEAVREVVKEG